MGVLPGHLILIALTHCVIAVFGYVLTASCIPSLLIKSYFVTRVVCSYFVGYIATISLIRVLSFTVNFSNIYYITIPTIIFLCALFLIKTKPVSHTINLSLLNKHTFFPQFLLSVLYFVLLFFILMIQVFQADFSWAGENFYLNYFKLWEGKEHLPIVTQHYGELIINFMMQSLNNSYNPLVDWWFSLGLVKLSVWVFLFVLLRNIISSIPSALIFSTFLVAGTTSILPDKYYLLFAGNNPVIFNGFAGKAASEAMTLFVIFSIIGPRLFDQTRAEPANDNSARKVPIIILFMLGVSATVITNLFWIIILCTVSFALYMRHKVDIEFSLPENFIMVVFVYFSVFVCIVLYSLPFGSMVSINIRLVLVGMVVFGAMSLAYMTIRNVVRGVKGGMEQGEPTNTFIFSMVLTSGIFGLLFLGNLTVQNNLAELFINILSSLFGEIEITNVNLTEGGLGSLIFGDYRELGSWNEFNKDVMHFISYYGAILAIALISVCLFEREKKRIISSDLISYILFGILVICTLALPIFLLFMDFNESSGRTWIKSLFLHIPVSMIFFSTFCLIFRVGRKWEKAAANVYLLVYTVTPFIATQRIEQITENTSMFFSMLKPLVR